MAQHLKPMPPKNVTGALATRGLFGSDGMVERAFFLNGYWVTTAYFRDHRCTVGHSWLQPSLFHKLLLLNLPHIQVGYQVLCLYMLKL